MAADVSTSVEANQVMTIDVDATYDPASGLSLDEHRQQELAKIQQPGFGQEPPKPRQAATVPPAPEVTDDGE